MKASERQVGGSHYRTASGNIGHWDYCVTVSVPYLEGCASKYLTRWRDKNGVQDLEKAAHYIERRIEALFSYQGILRGVRKHKEHFARFIADNQIPKLEEHLIDEIIHWRFPSQLQQALTELKTFIEQVKQEEGHPTSDYVNQDR